MNASQCVAVRSSWIAMVILMCDNTLSVLFKDGFCCNYPRTSAAHFRAMLAAPSKGRWLHRNLYKILPYRPIRLPCPAAGCGQTIACCPGVTIPNTLHATVNLGGGTVVLTYDGSEYWSAGGIALNCGDVISLRLACNPGFTDCSGLVLQYECGSSGIWTLMADPLGACTCSPLYLPYGPNLMSPFQGCPNCSGSSLSITVTA